MQPTLPQDIAIGLPFVASLFTHYLMADRLRAWQNALIAAVFVIGTAIACIWLSGTFIPGDPQASVLLVVAYVVMLMRGPLSVLAAFFASVPSPFDASPAPANPNPVRVPTALTLPPNASPVPPRTSQQPPAPPSA